MTLQQQWESEVYQGQFGDFTITTSDRTGVIVYRSGLVLAALSFAIGSAIVLLQGDNPTFLTLLTPLYALFCLALGVSLVAIHIYMESLHRLLQLFWGIGSIAAIVIGFSSSEPLLLSIYDRPTTLFGIGFTFVALTGVYFKEAFCFNRLETKFLTPLVPMLLVGHLTGILPIAGERVLLGIWTVLFIVFALRKVIQPIPPDIGDKSVFAYLKDKSSVNS